ncbi:hypothetical protein RFI_26045 [Reticulomyxa filosa]|uniref:Uncharacterized protein n=1 Tax=Reticulomyxa filosa TaxID=46433 RepID=X6MBT6_RETFI|nr:hypothetical protein RFI_26045 [Reticulomyxa filosa]|eukprot:ETO11329.1 hypothetical protein RFI_26045 [Reticulomyxa filosa]
MAQSTESIFGTDQNRRGDYTFGKGKILYYKPSKGYPTPEDAKRKPASELHLEHVYGFNGGALANKYYRYKQHLIAKDGQVKKKEKNKIKYYDICILIIIKIKMI